MKEYGNFGHTEIFYICLLSAGHCEKGGKGVGGVLDRISNVFIQVC